VNREATSLVATASAAATTTAATFSVATAAAAATATIAAATAAAAGSAAAITAATAARAAAAAATATIAGAGTSLIDHDVAAPDLLAVHVRYGGVKLIGLDVQERKAASFDDSHIRRLVGRECLQETLLCGSVGDVTDV
jgi:hypothetical protein